MNRQKITNSFKRPLNDCMRAFPTKIDENVDGDKKIRLTFSHEKNHRTKKGFFFFSIPSYHTFL